MLRIPTRIPAAIKTPNGSSNWLGERLICGVKLRMPPPTLARTTIHRVNGKIIPRRNFPTGIFRVPATMEVGTINPGIERPSAIVKEECLLIVLPAFSMDTGLNFV
jgi:hypothetical protein